MKTTWLLILALAFALGKLAIWPPTKLIWEGDTPNPCQEADQETSLRTTLCKAQMSDLQGFGPLITPQVDKQKQLIEGSVAVLVCALALIILELRDKRITKIS